MTLGVVLPTFNRATLLGKTLDSLMQAYVPSQLAVTIFVVNNNSSDNTAEVIETYRREMTNLNLVYETQQGSSAAMNAGIRASKSDLVAFINDDEEVDATWFEVIYKFFAGHPEVAFAGGPYRPNWSQAKPDWITRNFGGIVGWVDAGHERKEFGPNLNAMLMAGNAVVRRGVFDQIGLFDTSLGRFGTGVDACEDEEMFRRLLAANFRGMYLPELIIHHHIPAERMTRKYFRRSCWARGVSYGKLSKRLSFQQTSAVEQLFGIPRWQIRRALRGLLTAFKGTLGKASTADAFAGELYVWELAGYIRGRLSVDAQAPRMSPARPGATGVQKLC